MFEEWIIRTLFAMVIVNVFIAGLYLLLRGHLTLRTLKKFQTRTTAVMERMGRLGAVVKWMRQGESVHSVEPHWFTLRKREKIYIYTSPHSYEYVLDTWPHNGRGLMAAGILLMALSLGGFFLLIF